ncbi:MAG: gamma-glutamyltransferase, partial [Bacteroidales bacterium]
MRSFLVVTLTITVLFISCTDKQSKEKIGPVARNAMVVTAHPLATEIGINIIQGGGNAIDAATAIQFALAVCYPSAGNIGGGGFMVVRFSNGTVNSLDFREKAPQKGHRDMYLDNEGNVIEGLSEKSHLAVGVPGTVAGMLKMHDRYGILTFTEVIQPAIDLARNGFPVTEKQALSLNDKRDLFLAMNDYPTAFVRDSGWKAGDILIQKELAVTLERVRDQGRDGFYKGETAENIVREMERGGGLITLKDLEKYQAVWRKPITGDYKDYRIISVGPPSSGGIALMQLLGMV